ncbi:hypothetical protein ABEV55_13745 [Aneurinibacillus thermoaerophilus]|uniref:homing endonuclease associated repeat-containing protein n=1 Tax=Aneurinibacillus thermoaerophilus TaxID=143495 RepID=UPI002E1E047C|nr:hypothetical protein [Aneurinibacillus thermoaerophilus]
MASKITASSVFEETGKMLLANPKPLPIKPNRRVKRPNQKEKYEKEFEFHRTSIRVNIELVESLLTLYNEIAQKQYGKEEVGEVEMSTTLPCTVYYYFCKENGLKVDENFFDDEYFERMYTYQDNGILEAIRELERKIGKPITRTDWENYRKEVGGPSLSTIIRRYGSFSKAKELARQDE